MGGPPTEGRPPILYGDYAGTYLLTEARQILATCERVELGARQISAGVRGWLAVGFTRSSMYSVLPPTLSAFHAAHPRVGLKLYEMVTEDQPDALRERRIHIGIGRQPAPVAGCTTRELLRERVMAVLSPRHPMATADEVRIDDIVESPLILFPGGSSGQFARSVESLYRDAGFVPPIEYRTFEIQTAIGLVAADLGVTFVGESVARHGRTDVVYRHLTGLDAAATSTLVATYRVEDDSPHLRAFLACLPDLDATIGADA